MENEKELSGKESIDIIMNMINATKTNLQDDSFYFLFWGWLVFAASLGEYFLIKINFEYHFLPWMLMPLGGIVTALYGRWQNKKVKHKTYVDEFMKYVLISFLISLCMVLFSQGKLGFNTYPMVLMVYGMWLFTSGGVIKFKPLIIGGIINWVLAIVSFFVSFEIQLLILALAVLLGYIIPGYLLKRKYSANV